MSAGRVVDVSAEEVEAFKGRWPCSGLGTGRYRFEFAANGDVVEIAGPNDAEDGPAVAALADDAKAGKVGTVRA